MAEKANAPLADLQKQWQLLQKEYEYEKDVFWQNTREATLARKVHGELNSYVFCDTNGIASCDDGIMARLYENGGSCVLLYASENDEMKYITLGFEATVEKIETVDGDTQASSFISNKKTFLTLPPSRIGAVWLHK